MLPSWVVKMVRRGGWGSGLRERVGIYRRRLESERTGGIYIHAVSVGEVQLAKKLIASWQKTESEAHFVLVPTTATGRAMADEIASDAVRVIYSPLDFRGLVRRMIRRFQPSQIVLMESELWPNLIDIAARKGVPVSVANARLSERSARRYAKLGALTRPVFSQLGTVCVPEKDDVDRWSRLGVAAVNVVVTGSLKYDQSGAVLPARRPEFTEMIAAFGADRQAVMLSSTHVGEEQVLAKVVRRVMPEALLLVVPRHEERRAEVQRDLSQIGVESVLRSHFEPPSDGSGSALVVDVTGELRDWTAHADIVIIGKSWLARGGQSPVEAIAACKPVIVGPHMENFAALAKALEQAGGVISCGDITELEAALRRAVNADEVERLTDAALSILTAHDGATARMVEALALASS